MKSCPSRARRMLSALTCMTLAFALSACAGRMQMIPVALDCAGLIPERWSEPVPAPDLPETATVGAWVAFGDAAVGRLEIANDRTAGAIEIARQCQAAQAGAVREIERPWWRWWG